MSAHDFLDHQYRAEATAANPTRAIHALCRNEPPPTRHPPRTPQIGSDAAWVTVKIVLRTLCLTLGIILTGFALAAIATYQNLTQNNRGRLILVLPFIMLAIGVLAAVWNGAEFITMCARRSRRKGITAKAHVGADLFLWVLGVAGSAIQSIMGLEYGARGPATVCLLAVLGVLEFALFVRSCLEVDRRKKDRRIQQLVVALQMQQQQQYQQGQHMPQQHNGNIPSPSSESTAWGPAAAAAPPMSDYDRELNMKYQGPMPEPLYDPRDLQKVLIVDPRLRGIVN
ncbi:hypothetical protein PG996_013949 [Apiospora saccharicola]|uniref:MARVEL domain-containing protein n=1 Tax=Apiospora saccharicola TaxID=335842 RepID=A0ABR1TGX0_9PEZI